MTDTTETIRDDMAETRADMSLTIGELRSRASEGVRSAKQKLDVARLVRDNPWSALGVAVVLGAVIGGSGADEKAAAATAAGVRQAARASTEAAKGALEKLRSRHDDDAEMSDLETEVAHGDAKPGLGARLLLVATAPISSVCDRLLDELRVASHNWGARMAKSARARTSAPTVATAVVASDELAAVRTAVANAAVPVPNEMYPTELDARADAVEALGGGTDEPPLAPGAGDLGARWA